MKKIPRLLGNPIYGSTRIGMANTQARIVNIVRVETVSSNTTITVSEVKVDKATYYGNKRYELVGNTGSVHVVISDRKIVTSSGISADILEVNDYYAWGQEIKSRSWSSESDRYLFGYQDMLRENTVNGEGNMYSTEFRMFDARLGRWLSLDPLMDEFPWMSPFVAFDNNPIYFTDPYGLSSEGGGGKQDFTFREGGEEPKQSREGRMYNPDGKGGKSGKVKKPKPRKPKQSAFEKKLIKRLKEQNKVKKKVVKAEETKTKCFPNAPQIKGNVPESKPDKYIVVPGTTKEISTNRNGNYASTVLIPASQKGKGPGGAILFVGLSAVYILNNLSEENAYISDITENPEYSESSTTAPSNPDDFDDDDFDDDNLSKNKNKNKKDKLRGGKQNKRDSYLKSKPKEFQRWFHQRKQQESRKFDSSNEEINELYKEWESGAQP